MTTEGDGCRVSGVGTSDGVGDEVGVTVGVDDRVRVEKGIGVAVGDVAAIGVDGSVAGISIGTGVGGTVAFGEADGVGVGVETGAAGASAVPHAASSQQPTPITHNLAHVTSVPPP